MNSKIKSFLCVLFCFVLLFTISPLQSFASTNSFKFNCPEPYVDEHNSYIALNFGNGEGYLYRFSFYPVANNVRYDDFADNVNDVLDISVMITGFSRANNMTQLNYYVLCNAVVDFNLSISYITPEGLCKYYPIQVCEGSTAGALAWNGNKYIHNYFLKGNMYVEGDSNFPIQYIMNPEWGSDTSYHSELDSIINSLMQLHSDNLDLIDLYIEAVNSLSTLHDDNIEIVEKLTELLSGVVLLHSDNVELLSQFAKLLADTKNIRSNLDLIVNYIYDFLDWHLFEIEYYLMDTLDKLDYIIDLLQPDTDVNVSKVDPSNFNEYNKAEQDLINNDGVDVTGAMNVEINQQALTYIWPLVERCLNANPKVIGLTFTILAVSLVALILGRKGG